jgi:hypothetical protein
MAEPARQEHPQRSWLQQPAPASRPRRQPSGQPPIPLSGRPARLDGLMIGAPLTAAFIGTLLAEGADSGLARAADEGTLPAARPPRGADAGDAPPPGGHGQIGGGVPSDGVIALAGSGTAAPVVGLAPPVAAPTPPLAAAAPIELSLPQAAAAPLAAAGAGPTLSLTMMRLDLDQGVLDDPGQGLPPDPDAAIGIQRRGGSGNDVIHGTERNDHLTGGAGNDVIFGHGGDDRLEGGDGDDRLHGGSGADRLLGNEGDDRLFGQGGNDVLQGGAGDDWLDGGSGADLMMGGAGDDTLIMADLHDVALEHRFGPGLGGEDTLILADGFAAQLPFGYQTATILFAENFGQALPGDVQPYRQLISRGIEHVKLEGSADFDIIGDSRANHLVGNAGANRLYGMAGDDVLEGGAGQDRLEGGAGNDRLYGNSGDDLLRGGAGDDALYGGSGDDLLAGGPGRDLLYGGSGKDTYLFDLRDGGGSSLVVDHEGSNLLQIRGLAGQTVKAMLNGRDLHVAAGETELAVLRDYVGHEDAWAGIDLGRGVTAIKDLLAPYLPPPAAAAADWLSAPSSAPAAASPAASTVPAAAVAAVEPASADPGIADALQGMPATGDELFA